MNRFPLVIATIILLLSSVTMRAQSVARVHQSTNEAANRDANAKAIAALINRDAALAKKVIDADNDIDRMEVDVASETVVCHCCSMAIALRVVDDYRCGGIWHIFLQSPPLGG